MKSNPSATQWILVLDRDQTGPDDLTFFGPFPTWEAAYQAQQRFWALAPTESDGATYISELGTQTVDMYWTNPDDKLASEDPS